MVQVSPARAGALLAHARATHLAVIGDVMLDQYIWGRVNRISPEAPVPILEFESESWMPGGAANVARNLTALGSTAELFGVVGPDDAAPRLRAQLKSEKVGCRGLMNQLDRPTTTKTRLAAGHQQIVRLDREISTPVPAKVTRDLLRRFDSISDQLDAVIVADYGKGLVTQELIDGLRERCRRRGTWLSVDPKPVHLLNLKRVSLLTPNRKEAFALAGMPDSGRRGDPLQDAELLAVGRKLLTELCPAVLLVTLGEFGLLLCQRDQPPIHIPTLAREVFDVSGAGDTVIATYTLAICSGASVVEAAVLANHAAGLVVGKRGTATVSADELQASFR